MSHPLFKRGDLLKIKDNTWESAKSEADCYALYNNEDCTGIRTTSYPRMYLRGQLIEYIRHVDNEVSVAYIPVLNKYICCYTSRFECLKGSDNV